MLLVLHNTSDNLPYEVQPNQHIFNLAEKPNKCQKDLFISSDKKIINTTRNKLLKKKKKEDAYVWYFALLN